MFSVLVESVYNIRWLRYARFSYQSITSGRDVRPYVSTFGIQNSQALPANILDETLSNLFDFMDKY